MKICYIEFDTNCPPNLLCDISNLCLKLKCNKKKRKDKFNTDLAAKAWYYKSVIDINGLLGCP